VKKNIINFLFLKKKRKLFNNNNRKDENILFSALSIIRNVSEIHASILQETRKMVNFGRAGRSQMKIWWRIEELLTCKSLFRLC